MMGNYHVRFLGDGGNGNIFSVTRRSIDSKQGSCKIIYCDNEQDVDNALQVIKKRRKARGYRLTE